MKQTCHKHIHVCHLIKNSIFSINADKGPNPLKASVFLTWLQVIEFLMSTSRKVYLHTYLVVVN